MLVVRGVQDALCEHIGRLAVSGNVLGLREFEFAQKSERS